MPKSIRNRESLIENGEGPGETGFKVETANGTGHWMGTGWNWLPPLTTPQVEPSPTHPPGRNNRTAE